MSNIISQWLFWAIEFSCIFFTSVLACGYDVKIIQVFFIGRIFYENKFEFAPTTLNADVRHISSQLNLFTDYVICLYCFVYFECLFVLVVCVAIYYSVNNVYIKIPQIILRKDKSIHVWFICLFSSIVTNFRDGNSRCILTQLQVFNPPFIPNYIYTTDLSQIWSAA